MVIRLHQVNNSDSEGGLVGLDVECSPLDSWDGHCPWGSWVIWSWVFMTVFSSSLAFYLNYPFIWLVEDLQTHKIIAISLQLSSDSFFVKLHIQSIFSNIQLLEWPKTKDNEKTSYHRVGSQIEALLWKARSLREEEVSSLTRSAAVQLPSCTLKTGFWQLCQSLRSDPILLLFSFLASPSSHLLLSASCSWFEVGAWTHFRPLSDASSQQTVGIGLGSGDYSAETFGI